MDIDRPLERLAEAFDFYFKLDVAVLGGAAALLSIFEIEGPEVVDALSEYRRLLAVLGALLIAALFLKYLTTVARAGSEDLPKYPRASKSLLALLHIGHFLQVAGHGLMFAYIVGFAAGYLDAWSSVPK